MALYGTLGDYRFADIQEAALDIRGAALYGVNDEKLGAIYDVIFDQATGAIVYAVVDTGGWLTTRLFIVPPTAIRPSLQHENDFLADLTKEQIEKLPAYDGTVLNSEEQWADYEKSYRSKWVDGPVMHREGTDRNVTPTTKQQVGAGSGTISAEDDTAELESESQITALHPDATMDVTPGGPSMRWSAFEDTLRQRREDVLRSSIENLKRASGETLAERRKAS